MPEKNSRLNALQSQKQLLIAESELNRARMIGDATALKAQVRALGEHVLSLRTLAASAAALVSDLTASPGGETADAGARPSWLRRVLRGAGLASKLWLVFRAARRKRDGD